MAGWQSISGDEPAPTIPTPPVPIGDAPYRDGVAQGVRDACGSTPAKPKAGGPGPATAGLMAGASAGVSAVGAQTHRAKRTIAAITPSSEIIPRTSARDGITTAPALAGPAPDATAPSRAG
jgi:hypothetical protein